MNRIPQEQRKRYCRAGITASAGTRIRATTALVQSAEMRVRTIAINVKRENIVPMDARTSSLLRAPTYWPMRTVPPVARPVTRLVMACIT